MRVCKRCHGPLSKVNKYGYCFKKEGCRVLGRRAAYSTHKRQVLNKSIQQLRRESKAVLV